MIPSIKEDGTGIVDYIKDAMNAVFRSNKDVGPNRMTMWQSSFEL